MFYFVYCAKKAKGTLKVVIIKWLYSVG